MNTNPARAAPAIALAFSLGGGCRSDPPPPLVERAPIPDIDVPRPAFEPRGERSKENAVLSATAPDCRKTLSFEALTVTPGCWVDEKVSHRSAVLEYPCASGDAKADFGAPFVGSVDGSKVTLDATTTFAWGDGCEWQSRQRIVGSLASGTVEYSYEESPTRGTHCASSHCKATGHGRIR